MQNALLLCVVLPRPMDPALPALSHSKPAPSLAAADRPLPQNLRRSGVDEAGLATLLSNPQTLRDQRRARRVMPQVGRVGRDAGRPGHAVVVCTREPHSQPSTRCGCCCLHLRLWPLPDFPPGTPRPCLLQLELIFGQEGAAEVTSKRPALLGSSPSTVLRALAAMAVCGVQAPLALARRSPILLQVSMSWRLWTV